MTTDECEVVADAGVRLRIIADGMLASAKLLDSFDYGGEAFRQYARTVDEVRVRLCALPLESEGDVA